MKSTLLAFSFLFSVSAFAETIILSPGESGFIGSTKIVCSGQPQVSDTGPVCKLVGSGAFNGNTWRYRVGINNDVVSAVDDLDAALQMVNRLRESGLCGSAPAGICKLAGPGAFHGNTWSNRIALGDIVVAAVDDQAAAINMVTKLRRAGLCK